MAIRREAGISVVRGWSTQKLIQEYNAALATGYDEVVFHARIGTGGTISLNNTHPFKVNKNVLLFHNGILRDVDESSDKTRPDTYHYARLLQPYFDKDPLVAETEDFLEAIETYAKKHSSKFVIMDVLGGTTIVNKNAGIVRDGCWYSNQSAFGYGYQHTADSRNAFVRRNLSTWEEDLAHKHGAIWIDGVRHTYEQLREKQAADRKLARAILQEPTNKFGKKWSDTRLRCDHFKLFSESCEPCVADRLKKRVDATSAFTFCSHGLALTVQCLQCQEDANKENAHAATRYLGKKKRRGHRGRGGRAQTATEIIASSQSRRLRDEKPDDQDLVTQARELARSE